MEESEPVSSSGPTASPDSLARCISIDLEVGRGSSRIHAFAGVRADTGRCVIFSKTDHHPQPPLDKLDGLAEGAEFVLGHNLIKFDLPHLREERPALRLLQLPVIDTLWLSPLAFPRHPYHRLVKHYKDGQLNREKPNDPELDARLTLKVFADQQKQLLETPPHLLIAWHWLTTQSGETGESGGTGFDLLFESLRRSPRPDINEAREAVRQSLDGRSCHQKLRSITADLAEHGWGLAYALAWISVSGGNSVLPPWVRHSFVAAAELVRRLRDEACGHRSCDWCRRHHDPVSELNRWFGFEQFRPEPVDPDTQQPMQQAIVETAMHNQDALAILPTGTGKSLCYQLPALSRYNKTGAMTVVISPLVALMADQVAGLEKLGVTTCVTVNGTLSMPERTEALKKVRLGDAAILLISPEQLRTELNRLSGLVPDWDWSRCAVIAAEWSHLEPVRSLCEHLNIPVQKANETEMSLWRLRETQALVRKARGSNLVDISGLREWIRRQRPSPWFELLDQALDEHQVESGSAKVPNTALIEWLAEWCRGARRRQRGLLLLTAHRAKGLEFDHVIVLDGGWDRRNRGDDADAQRRLYYVAMTRARQTLALLRRKEPHPFHAGLHHRPSVLLRETTTSPRPGPELTRRHRQLALNEVFLSFAGNKPPEDHLHTAIAALSPGDRVQVNQDEQPWKLLNQAGTTVGILAQSFKPPDNMVFTNATVAAIATWGKDRSDAKYLDRVMCENWEVVLPELIFEPRISSDDGYSRGL